MLMLELYNIITIFINSSLMTTYGLMLLFTFIPDNLLLGNYRKARQMMAGACLFIAAAVVVEYLFQSPVPSDDDIALIQTVTLAISVSQALLFTFALLSLLEVRFPGWRYIIMESSIALLLITAIVASYALFSGKTFSSVFYILIAIYALLLIRYTMLFVRTYRHFCMRMDNYFSDTEAGRLRWVAFSFFAALVIGVTALLSSLFMSRIIGILFAVIFDTFYLYFAIRFINYAHLFHTIEQAMDGDMQEVETQSFASLPYKPAEGSGIGIIHDDTLARLEKQIEKWIDNKGFIEKGITIDMLAVQLCTNSKYLSIYINTCKKQTFRDWINELRIGESKTMLLEHPEMTGNEISRQTGFADRSHFLRQFKKHTGISPAEWKKLAEMQKKTV